MTKPANSRRDFLNSGGSALGATSLVANAPLALSGKTQGHGLTRVHSVSRCFC